MVVSVLPSFFVLVDGLVGGGDLVRKLRLSSSHVNLAAINHSALNFCDELLHNLVLVVSDETKSFALSCGRISDDLSVLHRAVLFEMLSELFIRKIIIETTDEYLVFDSLRVFKALKFLVLSFEVKSVSAVATLILVSKVVAS